ncbi:NAD(P)-dependent oxidoreductase [Shewanella sp. PP-Sp27a-2]
MKIVVTEAMPTPSGEASTTEANIPQVVLITGARSQLAQALLRVAADIGELALNSIANTSTNISANTGAPLKLYALSRSQLDITDAASIAAVFAQYRPSWVINCAAYNAVDAAEHDAIEAHRVNALGPELLAQQCLLSGARLLHVSSDYVFSDQAVCDSAHAAERAIGDAKESGVEQHKNPDLAPNSNSNPNPNHLPRPFVELDAPEPLSAYGTSKLLGEQRVVAVLGDGATIVRTSWLYGQDGHNFVNTMLNLMRTQPSLQVIVDQIGCPTWSDALAKVIWQLVVQQCSGVFHYSAQGQCSWYEFACEIQRQALALNLLSLPVVIQPITSAHYAKQALNRGVGLAKRPSYSVLNSGKLRSTLVTHHALLMPEHVEWQDWRQQLNCMLRRLS